LSQPLGLKALTEPTFGQTLTTPPHIGNISKLVP